MISFLEKHSSMYGPLPEVEDKRKKFLEKGYAATRKANLQT